MLLALLLAQVSSAGASHRVMQYPVHRLCFHSGSSSTDTSSCGCACRTSPDLIDPDGIDMDDCGDNYPDARQPTHKKVVNISQLHQMSDGA